VYSVRVWVGEGVRLKVDKLIFDFVSRVGVHQFLSLMDSRHMRPVPSGYSWNLSFTYSP